MFSRPRPLIASVMLATTLASGLAGCGDAGPVGEPPLSEEALGAVTENPGAPTRQLARQVDDLFTMEGLGETRAVVLMHGGTIAAERYARRKRIGPYASAAPDPKQREKAIAAFLRAGHSYAIARRWVDAALGERAMGLAAAHGDGEAIEAGEQRVAGILHAVEVAGGNVQGEDCFGRWILQRAFVDNHPRAAILARRWALLGGLKDKFNRAGDIVAHAGEQ